MKLSKTSTYGFLLKNGNEIACFVIVLFFLQVGLTEVDMIKQL